MASRAHLSIAPSDIISAWLAKVEEKTPRAGHGQEPRKATLALQPHKKKEPYMPKDVADPRTTCPRTIWEVTGFEAGFLVFCFV